MITTRRFGHSSRLAAWLFVLLGCAVFAAWPQSATPIALPKIEPLAPEKKVPPRLDLTAFRTPLWVADAAPPTAPVQAAPTPPPPPLKLQLLAIIHEGDAYKAALYDPDSDRLLIVAAGERIGTRSVESIDKAKLTLNDGAARRVLALKERQ